MRFWNGVLGAACCAVLTVALVAALGVGTAAASSSTLHVGTGGSDTPDCTDPSSPCATIQFAVDQASVGDTVEVAAGTYDEPQIVIDKPLTLQGAGAGETIVDGSSAILSGPLLRYESATVGDVTVRGFTFEGSNGDALGGEGLLLLFSTVPAGSRVNVLDNELLSRNDPYIATDWSLGLFVSSSAAAIDIEGNRFDGMWQGILVERSTGPTTIAGNEFTGLVSNTDGPNVYPGEGILLLSIGAGGAGDAVTSPQLVSDNYFHGYAGLGVAVQAGHSSAPDSPSSFSDVTVAGNEIALDGAMFPTGRPLAGVMLKTGQADSTIEGADIVGNTISVSAPGNDIAAEAAEGAISGTAAHANRLAGTPAAGLDASLAGPVDATDNWWGCNAGPGHPGCTAASGLVASVPNLVLRGVASRPRVEPGGSAVVSASLATDSAGVPVAGVPGGGAPVTFASGLGSLLPATAPLAGGTASATFRADGRVGDASVTVALDGQRVGVPLKVVSPPAKVLPRRSTARRPPMVKPIGAGPRDVPANGRVTVAWVSCPQGTCRVVVKSPKVTIGGRAYEVRVRVPKRVSAGHPARVRVVLSKAARRAFAEQGRGRVTLRLAVTAPDGTRRAMRVTVVLKDKQGKPHRHGQG